jgi:hypothetical protein
MMKCSIAVSNESLWAATSQLELRPASIAALPQLHRTVVDGIGATQYFCALICGVLPSAHIFQLQHATRFVIAMQSMDHVSACGGAGKQVAEQHVHDRGSDSAERADQAGHFSLGLSKAKKSWSSSGIRISPARALNHTAHFQQQKATSMLSVFSGS